MYISIHLSRSRSQSFSANQKHQSLPKMIYIYSIFGRDWCFWLLQVQAFFFSSSFFFTHYMEKLFSLLCQLCMIKIIKITICLVFRYSVSTNGKLASIMPGMNPVKVGSQKLLTPSLLQPVKCTHTPAYRIFFSPIPNLLSILCVLMEFVSHTNAKKERGVEKFQIWHFYYFQATSWQSKG